MQWKEQILAMRRKSDQAFEDQTLVQGRVDKFCVGLGFAVRYETGKNKLGLQKNVTTLKPERFSGEPNTNSDRPPIKNHLYRFWGFGGM